ncbi:hypothetical protein CL633_01600 [bacterium]|nr:hypothetical protein [bacterium]|tara:strand:+ start:10025 stop:11281 length:1257 start_codon:yes stop_codon:yes gene_type:complete
MKNSRNILIYILIIAVFVQSFPYLSLIMHVVVDFLSPFQFQVFPLDIIVFVIIFWAILKRGIFLRVILKKCNLEHLALAYVCMGLIAVLTGYFRGESNLFFDFRLYFFFLLVPALIYYIKTKKELDKIIKFLITTNTTFVLYAFLIDFVLSGFKFGYLRINREMNLYCLILMFCLFFYNKRDSFLKFTSYFAMPLSFLVMLIDNSRKQYLGFVIALVFLLFLGRKYCTSKKVIFAILVIACLLSIALGVIGSFSILQDVYDRATYLTFSDQSIGFRVSALKFTIQNVMLEHPIFGLGTGDRFAFYNALSKGLPLHFDYGVNIVNGRVNLHNMYLSIFVIGGLVGLSFFVYLLLVFLKKAWLAYKASENKERFLALGVFLGFLTFLAGQFFSGLTMGTITETWFLAGLCLASFNLNKKI